MKYRHEIDGLRALAIVPVIWLHAGFSGLSGGFLGVDVFFVISGFLITSILLKEIASGTFSITSFYERRARRILPALFIVAALTTPVLVAVTQSPETLRNYGASLVSVATFVSNFYFWQTSGYFGTTSELSPMLHTWSLAVEEQFYIIFPLLALWIAPLGRRWFAWSIAVILLASLVIAQVWQQADPSGNFYLLPSRAWELMAGSLASLIFSGRYIDKISKNVSNLLALIGVFLIIASYIAFTPQTAHPSFLTVVPVTGTVLVLLFARADNLTGRCLSVPLFIQIGIISYSLYLWHQPVFALSRIHTGGHLGVPMALAGIVLTVVLSLLSYRFIETPFRNRQRFIRPQVFSASAAGLIVAGVTGLLFINNVPLRKYIEPENMARFETLATAHASHTSQPMVDEPCKIWSPVLDAAFTKKFEQCHQQHGQAIFVIGGSHGMDLYNAIAVNSPHKFVVSVSRGFCRAHGYNGNPKDLPHCQYEDFRQFATKYGDAIKLVLYTQTPDRLFVNNDIHDKNGNEINEQYVSDLVRYLTSLKVDHNLNVAVIGMLPPITKNPVDWDYRQSLKQQAAEYRSPVAEERARQLDKLLGNRLSDAGIRYISKFEGMQLEYPDDLIIDGALTYSDKRHLSQHGEKVFGERLWTHLKEQTIVD